MSARILPFSAQPQGRGAAERAFLPAALEIVETPASPTFRITAALISAFLLAAVLWSYFGRVDIIATAPGKVIARDRTKIIQPADSGVVRAIAVADGQHVKKGQVLIRLDPTMAEADEARYGGVLVQAELDRARLKAEVTPMAGDPFAGVSAPADLLAAARARLQADLREQAAKIADIDEEIAGKSAEEAAIEAEIAKIDAAMPMVSARVNIRAGALKSGYGNELDYFQQRQELVEMQHERIVDQKKHEEAVAALAALATQRAKTIAEFRSAAFADLAKTDREIAETVGELAKAARQVQLQTLRAPIDGIVQDLAVHTLGGAVTPAQQVLRIVPLSGGIEVEAVIANRDVGFVGVGQKAEIKIATFPFTHYGLIHGHVREIAHDSVEEPADNQHRQGTESASETPRGIARSHQLVYTARIALGRTALDINGKEVALEPGMAVTAEIKTGRRRVLDYLLSPFHRYAHDALRER